MMLDVTGSMAGSKIVDLKSGAEDLVSIVITEGVYARKVRVALVPFSERRTPAFDAPIQRRAARLRRRRRYPTSPAAKPTTPPITGRIASSNGQARTSTPTLRRAPAIT